MFPVKHPCNPHITLKPCFIEAKLAEAAMKRERSRMWRLDRVKGAGVVMVAGISKVENCLYSLLEN